MLLAFPILGKAQSSDSSVLEVPRKATMWSALIPGAGQIYNRSYWKVPILYAGFGALGYAFNFNQTEYKLYAGYYQLAVDGDPNTNPPINATDQQLRDQRNYYKKNRDLTVIGMVALYALQILDANVDAHLSSFNVNDNLSLGLQYTPLTQSFQHSHRPYSNPLSLGLKLRF
ncbi:MAG: hypothetical protein EP332_00310 [Bacteroidetes bacterium]|nr:MAG: hypothetical protein EP332_00310 [Bacteroidota bacterium]